MGGDIVLVIGAFFQPDIGDGLGKGGTTTRGTIELREGTFKGYGQDLKIERGRFLFVGPPDNPNFDIRALRLIQGVRGLVRQHPKEAVLSAARMARQHRLFRYKDLRRLTEGKDTYPAWSPDGRSIAAGADDGTVTLWQVPADADSTPAAPGPSGGAK